MTADTTYQMAVIRSELHKYKPGHTLAERADIPYPESLHIGLYGLTGCGKSSLINSLKFTADTQLRRGQWVQISPQVAMGGHTMQRTDISLFRNIHVVDNRGMTNPNAENLLPELEAQIFGKRGYSKAVDWSGRVTDESSEPGDCISVVILVLSAKQAIGEDVEELLKLVPDLIRLLGRYPLAVITHADISEPEKVDELKIHLNLLHISEIFCVDNINDDKFCLEIRYQSTLLSLLDRCMTDGDQSIVFRERRLAAYQRPTMDVPEVHGPTNRQRTKENCCKCHII